MDTPSEIRTRVIEKASEDNEFRAHLLSDPKAALKDELDITIPEAMAVQVHEENAETAHLILPPNSKLSKSDMQAVHGGYYIDRFGNRVSEAEWNRGNLNW